MAGSKVAGTIFSTGAKLMVKVDRAEPPIALLLERAPCRLPFNYKHAVALVVYV